MKNKVSRKTQNPLEILGKLTVSDKVSLSFLAN